MGFLLSALLNRLKVKLATEREQAADTLAELLAEHRNSNPRRGDEDRLAAALKVLGIPPEEVDTYQEFVAGWEADRLASADVDKLRRALRNAQQDNLAYGRERERILAELHQREARVRNQLTLAYHHLGEANKAAEQAKWREDKWAKFRAGRPLFAQQGAPLK